MASARSSTLALIAFVLITGCGDGGGDRDDRLRLEPIGGGPNLCDGGPATATYLRPRDLAIDDVGNVFVVDESHVLGSVLIRRIDARTGVITTVAGSCHRTSPDEIASDACHLHDVGAIAAGDADELFAATIEGRLYRFESRGPRAGRLQHLAGRGEFAIDCSIIEGLPAREACLGFISSMALDPSGALYLANPSAAVSRFRTPNVPLTAVAGLFDEFACTAGESIPDGALATSGCVHADDIVFDAGGDLVFSSSYDLRLRRVAATSGTITTIAGSGFPGFCTEPRGDGGPATEACFAQPLSVAASANGDFILADGNRLRRIDAATERIDPILTRAYVSRPVTAHDGTVLFIDDGQRVTRLDPATGAITPFAGNGTDSRCGDGGPAATASLGQPEGIAVAPDGTIYFADAENARVGRIDARSGITTTIAGGRRGFCGDGGPALEACFRHPTDVALDREGNLYVVDLGDDDQGGENDIVGRVRRIDVSTGIITTVVGNCTGFDLHQASAACLHYPTALLFVADGDLLIGEAGLVVRVDLGADTIEIVAGTISPQSSFMNCTADGIPARTSCDIGGKDLALDASGNLYVLGEKKVRRIDAQSNIVTTVAGNGVYDYCGEEDVPATSTCLRPTAIAIDDAGRLIIAENGGFRAVDLTSGRIRTIAGSPNPEACSSDIPPPSACTFATDIERDPAGRFIVSDVDDRRIQRLTLP